MILYPSNFQHWHNTPCMLQYTYERVIICPKIAYRCSEFWRPTRKRISLYWQTTNRMATNRSIHRHRWSVSYNPLRLPLKKCHKRKTRIFLNSRHTHNHASWHVILILISDLHLRSRHNTERKHENNRSVQNHERERLPNFRRQETVQSSLPNKNDGNHVRELGRIRNCNR